ncbi:hypothetical protein J6590_076773 [Homalodisca vitripennis]|nr:hypothetical protein J6590_076773 [Homalodisca vitripennis]
MSIAFPSSRISSVRGRRMESEEEVPRKRRKGNPYTADDFTKLRGSEQDAFIFYITDEMVNNSECGGDSEADDIWDSRQPSSFT